MHAVEFQLEAAEQVLDHDAQVVIEHPGSQTGQVLPLRLQLHQQAMKSCIYLLSLSIICNIKYIILFMTVTVIQQNFIA